VTKWPYEVLLLGINADDRPASILVSGFLRRDVLELLIPFGRLGCYPPLFVKLQRKTHLLEQSVYCRVTDLVAECLELVAKLLGAAPHRVTRCLFRQQALQIAEERGITVCKAVAPAPARFRHNRACRAASLQQAADPSG